VSTSKAAKQQQTAAIYARVSSEEQAQGYSIQLAETRTKTNKPAYHSSPLKFVTVFSRCAESVPEQ